MKIVPLAIPDVILIVPKRFGDNRGYFSEIYSARALAEAGIEATFVQDNLSVSAAAGTVRGLHFQRPPSAQAKLVRVGRGRVLDVAVDIRRGSPSYGRHVSTELSAEGGEQLFIPAGFAHGFCTLEPNTEVVYKVSNYYAPDAEAGILWRDSALGIAWPVAADKAVLSAKDAALPPFVELGDVF